MDKKFKWDMFITSFIPLWVSIFILDSWSIVSKAISLSKKDQYKLCNLLYQLFLNSMLELITIFIVIVLVLISSFGINSFLKKINSKSVKPTGLIKMARRANKLSSEYLLAYILPMIAFDYTALKDIVLFVVYFTVLAYLCIRNNNIYTNILLELKGYKMYTCDIECQVISKSYLYADCLVISKENLTSKIDKTFSYYDFDKYVYINIENN